MGWPRWLDARVRRRLALFTGLTVAGPWVVGEVAKSGMQAGMHDDPYRAAMLVDFIVIGSILFGLTMVMTYAIGCWITAVMHGPRRDGDAFPADADGDSSGGVQRGD